MYIKTKQHIYKCNLLRILLYYYVSCYYFLHEYCFKNIIRMGKVLSVLQRKINRFNVENRAHKVISLDKPIPAPMYPKMKEELERIIKDHPEMIKQEAAKNDELQKRLKDVYVKSHDSLPPAEPGHSNRPLPQERHTFEDPEFGFEEPEIIPHGRFSIRQAMKFITDYQADPVLWNAAVIAKEYKLDKNILEKILLHYRTFEVYIPQVVDDKKIPLYAQPSLIKDKLESGKHQA